jgi:two-component system, NarL family, response regulator DesR
VIRVLIVDDMGLAKSGLLALFEPAADVDVVAQIDSSQFIVPIAAALRPDVLIVNSEQPVSRIFRVVADLDATLRECAVLILADPRKPVALPPSRCAWTPNFLVNDAAPHALLDTVRRLAAGERMIDRRTALAALTPGGCVLSGRELDVLRLAADGARVGEIAGELYLSPGTIRNYISMVIRKTGARNRIDAIRIAREAGWLT